jgi:hypothetical protein
LDFPFGYPQPVVPRCSNSCPPATAGSRATIHGSLAALLIGLLAATFAAPPPAAAKSGPWISLETGTTGAYNWSVKVKDLSSSRDSGLGPPRPCVLVGASSRVQGLSFLRSSSRQCTEPSDPFTATSAPLIATAGQPSDRPSAKLTAIGMIFAAPVHRVQIAQDGGHLTTIHLRRISAGDARTAGLPPLRYAAFTVHGTWCAERLVSFDAAGVKLWDSGRGEYSCPATRPG